MEIQETPCRLHQDMGISMETPGDSVEGHSVEIDIGDSKESLHGYPWVDIHRSP